MKRRPTRSTRTDTRVPYTTLFRSGVDGRRADDANLIAGAAAGRRLIVAGGKRECGHREKRERTKHVQGPPGEVRSRRRRFGRSDERRVGKSVSVSVDLGGRRIIKKQN